MASFGALNLVSSARSSAPSSRSAAEAQPSDQELRDALRSTFGGSAALDARVPAAWQLVQRCALHQMCDVGASAGHGASSTFPARLPIAACIAGFEAFRGHQEAAIRAALTGASAWAQLPVAARRGCLHLAAVPLQRGACCPRMCTPLMPIMCHVLRHWRLRHGRLLADRHRRARGTARLAA